MDALPVAAHTQTAPSASVSTFPVEVGAYYIVAEALTNAAKHSHATEVTVSAHDEDANLYLSVSDNGIGGADPGKGSGLVGLNDRAEALGGKMTQYAGKRHHIERDQPSQHDAGSVVV